MTSTQYGTNFGVLSRAVWRVMARLTRHQFQVADRRRDDELQHGLLRALLNDGDGSLVISRFRGLRGSSPCEAVDSDMGTIWMPRYDTVILPTLRSTGTWEPDEQLFLRRSIAEGSTVLNVGANVGYTSLVLAGIVGPTGQVYALEPDPLNFRLLCVNTRGVETILPIHTAAGDTTGEILLNRSATNGGDHRTAPHEDGIGGVTVPIVGSTTSSPNPRSPRSSATHRGSTTG